MGIWKPNQFTLPSCVRYCYCALLTSYVMNVCVCVCVCVRARVCVRVCLCVLKLLTQLAVPK